MEKYHGDFFIRANFVSVSNYEGCSDGPIVETRGCGCCSSRNTLTPGRLDDVIVETKDFLAKLEKMRDEADWNLIRKTREENNDGR